MTVNEVSTRLRARLEEEYGVDEAAILMDRPPGGWNDFVTNASLHRELSALEGRIDLKLEALETRVDARFIAVDAKFDALGARMDAGFAAVDARFAGVDHRFERFEHQLLAMVDRRLRAQTWVMFSTLIAAMGMFAAVLKA